MCSAHTPRIFAKDLDLSFLMLFYLKGIFGACRELSRKKHFVLLLFRDTESCSLKSTLTHANKEVFLRRNTPRSPAIYCCHVYQALRCLVIHQHSLLFDIFLFYPRFLLRQCYLFPLSPCQRVWAGRCASAPCSVARWGSEVLGTAAGAVHGGTSIPRPRAVISSAGPWSASAARVLIPQHHCSGQQGATFWKLKDAKRSEGHAVAFPREKEKNCVRVVARGAV